MKKPEALNARDVLKTSLKEGITSYDASYIQAAADNKLTPVTGDSQLYRIGKSYVKTISSGASNLTRSRTRTQRYHDKST